MYSVTPQFETKTVAPSWLTETAYGKYPTGDLLNDLPVVVSMTATLLSPSQATYRILPSGLSAEPAGKVVCAPAVRLKPEGIGGLKPFPCTVLKYGSGT